MRPIELLDRHGQSRSINVIFNPNASLVRAWETEWAGQAAHRGESDHWDWLIKFLTFSGISETLFIALEERGSCHGMAIVSWPKQARLAPGVDLVYLEYLEVAPQNRADLTTTREIVGVGAALVELARRVSAALDYAGRIGLHSLPAAETFYRRLGMNDAGPDAAHQGLRYFEI